MNNLLVLHIFIRTLVILPTAGYINKSTTPELTTPTTPTTRYKVIPLQGLFINYPHFKYQEI